MTGAWIKGDISSQEKEDQKSTATQYCILPSQFCRVFFCNAIVLQCSYGGAVL